VVGYDNGKKMRKIFSSTYWKILLWQLKGVFAWAFSSPGLIGCYWHFIFMYQVFKGSTEATELTLTFRKSTKGPPLSKAVTIFAVSHAVDISLAYDGVNFSDWINIPPGDYYHFSFSARKAKIRNAEGTSGNTDFIFIAWYIISQY